MSRSLVSVVIPTYNRAYCIERALDSVLRQTHQDFEIILVDDGSTDGTSELIARRYGHDGRIRYILQQNAGVSAARNTGLRAVRGDFVALLDSDDVWKPWKVELQLRCLEQVPHAGMIWTDMEAVGADGRVLDPLLLRTMYSAYQWFSSEQLFSQTQAVPEISVPLPETAKDAKLHSGEIYSQMIMGNLVHTSTVLLRRERCEQVRTFNEGLRPAGEDFDFHLRTCRAGAVAFISVASIEYQKGMPDQLTNGSHKIDVARNFLRTIAPCLANDRARINLPRHMVNRVLADAHGWIGEAALDVGNIQEARAHLFRSLCRRPWQPRTSALFVIALFPPRLGHWLRDVHQRTK